MTVVVVGTLADRLGHTSQLVTVPANLYGRNFDVQRRFMQSPSTEYRSVQACTISVDVDHGPVIGEVKYLELGRSGTITAVSEIDGSSLGEGPWYYSPEILHRGGRDIELRSVAVTKRPASVALGPLDAFAGTLDDAARTIVYQSGFSGAVLQRAAAYDRGRKRGEPIVVVDRNPPAPAPQPELASRRAGVIEYRSAAQVTVKPGHRLIELLAVPYGVDALVEVRGRMIRESFSNTAFLGEQPARILATRDHDPHRIIGRVTNLEPFHREGLIATIQASDTMLGRESVELARDQLLDASIGFQIPDPAGERWEGRGRRRVVKALLREVSLVPEPAYPTRVINVRSPTAVG